jgi:outer membrane murein-binding lipoprotein Lpp
MSDPNTQSNIPIQALAPATVPALHHPPTVVSLQYTIVAAIASALISSFAASGGVSWASNAAVAKQQAELQEVRSDLKRLSEKVNEIYVIVDAAHPRTIPGRP